MKVSEVTGSFQFEFTVDTKNTMAHRSRSLEDENNLMMQRQPDDSPNFGRTGSMDLISRKTKAGEIFD